MLLLAEAATFEAPPSPAARSVVVDVVVGKGGGCVVDLVRDVLGDVAGVYVLGDVLVHGGCAAVFDEMALEAAVGAVGDDRGVDAVVLARGAGSVSFFSPPVGRVHPCKVLEPYPRAVDGGVASAPAYSARGDEFGALVGHVAGLSAPEAGRERAGSPLVVLGPAKVARLGLGLVGASGGNVAHLPTVEAFERRVGRLGKVP